MCICSLAAVWGIIIPRGTRFYQFCANPTSNPSNKWRFEAPSHLHSLLLFWAIIMQCISIIMHVFYVNDNLSPGATFIFCTLRFLIRSLCQLVSCRRFYELETHFVTFMSSRRCWCRRLSYIQWFSIDARRFSSVVLFLAAINNAKNRITFFRYEGILHKQNEAQLSRRIGVTLHAIMLSCHGEAL